MVQRPSPPGTAPAAQRTTAWPLALATICLIVYASLYPFADWRNQGISPLRFLTAPLPKYWTGFDVGINLLGYAPLGFLLALSALRSRRVSWAVSVAVLSSALLSLSMETLQSYLPSRIPSNVDLVLNTLGALLGACCAWALEKVGMVDRWSRFRARWFSRDARGALLLLLLWLLGLTVGIGARHRLGGVLILHVGRGRLGLRGWRGRRIVPTAPSAGLRVLGQQEGGSGKEIQCDQAKTCHKLVPRGKSVWLYACSSPFLSD